MEANELRIGNWIGVNNKEYTINSIIDKIRTDPSNRSEHDLICVNKLHSSFSVKDVNPIPITEEWLVMKFGATIDGRNDYWIDLKSARMKLYFHKGNYAEMDLYQDGKYISFKLSQIKYVHQLQNLYFALTGNELIIK